MTPLFTLLIVIVLASAFIGALWAIVGLYLLGRVAKSAYRKLDRLIPQMDATLKNTRAGRVNIGEHQQFLNQWMKAQHQLQRLNPIQRRKYTSQVDKLMNSATGAGVDFRAL